MADQHPDDNSLAWFDALPPKWREDIQTAHAQVAGLGITLGQADERITNLLADLPPDARDQLVADYLAPTWVPLLLSGVLAALAPVATPGDRPGATEVALAGLYAELDAAARRYFAAIGQPVTVHDKVQHARARIHGWES